MSVTNNHYEEVAYGLSIITDLDDIEWPLYCVYFTEFDCFAGQLRHSGWK